MEVTATGGVDLSGIAAIIPQITSMVLTLMMIKMVFSLIKEV